MDCTDNILRMNSATPPTLSGNGLSFLLHVILSRRRQHQNPKQVDIGQDQHIIQTALREMGEEIGILESSVRCMERVRMCPPKGLHMLRRRS